jgi:hypothetical protein
VNVCKNTQKRNTKLVRRAKKNESMAANLLVICDFE